jgi:hypothetical protein
MGETLKAHFAVSDSYLPAPLRLRRWGRGWKLTESATGDYSIYTARLVYRDIHGIERIILAFGAANVDRDELTIQDVQWQNSQITITEMTNGPNENFTRARQEIMSCVFARPNSGFVALPEKCFCTQFQFFGSRVYQDLRLLQQSNKFTAFVFWPI